jgi:hypothetical protein
MTIRCVVYTCNEYSDVLPGFSYLFNVYWSAQQPVAYAGCPKMDLPQNFEWFEVESRIAARWSDGLIEFLRKLDDDIICWLLEDYYLCRGVDHKAIESLADYMRMHPDILKIDMTADRLHSGKAGDIDYWGHVDLLRTPWETPYQFSTQCALWNRKHLLSVLKPEMSPWDFELRSDWPEHLHVLGTRQWPIRYVNFLGMGLGKDEYRTEHTRQGLGGTTVERIPDEHVQFMKEHDLFPKDRKLNNDANC